MEIPRSTQKKKKNYKKSHTQRERERERDCYYWGGYGASWHMNKFNPNQI